MLLDRLTHGEYDPAPIVLCPVTILQPQNFNMLTPAELETLAEQIAEIVAEKVTERLAAMRDPEQLMSNQESTENR